MVPHPLWERSAGCAALSDTKQIVRRIAKQLRLSLHNAAPQYSVERTRAPHRKAHGWAAFHSADRARHLCRWANEQRNCGPFQSGGAKSLRNFSDGIMKCRSPSTGLERASVWQTSGSFCCRTAPAIPPATSAHHRVDDVRVARSDELAIDRILR
jgi:hypothetical protein